MLVVRKDGQIYIGDVQGGEKSGQGKIIDKDRVLKIGEFEGRTMKNGRIKYL